jgi:hypothetical protein
MAVNTTTFSGKQFAVYAAAEETTGTFNTTDASYRKIDVEGITYPSFSPQQEFERRTGSGGRIDEFSQIFSSTRRQVTEFSLSGRLTQELWLMLMENVTGDEFDGGTGTDSVLSLATGYAGLNFKVGDDPASATDFANLLSIYFAAPTAADSYSIASCTCTSFSISADVDDFGGRMTYEATFQTLAVPARGEQAGLIAAASAVGTQLYLSDMVQKNIDIKDYTGSTDEDNIDPIFSSFNMSIETPVVFAGAGANGTVPDAWLKGMPDMTITFGGTIKYDVTTDNLIEAFRDPDGASYITFFLSDVAVAGTTETPTGEFFAASSSKKFGIWFGKSKLTSCDVSSDDMAMVNFEAKVTDPGAGNIAHFLGGDNA